MREKARRGPQDGYVIPDESAGGVVVRGRGDDLRVAVMFSQFRTWVLPKGGVEPGETPERAAVRELAEEVGLTRLEMRGELGQTEHDFERYGKRHHKRVHWFVFLAPDDAELTANPAEHAFDAGWFPVQEALSLLTHADQRRILRRALRRLQRQPSDP
jgi:8-oxo-dGTP pyrophosphatase MutT (NUDIX family)